MTDEELDKALRVYNHRQPFQPYLVEFFSGDKIRVEYREAIAFLSNLLWLYRGKGKSQSLFTSSSVCRLLDMIESA